MNSSAFLGLLHNAMLLLAVCFVYDAAALRRRPGQAGAQKFFTGIILGGMCIVIMLTPWQFKPGLFFDARSVLLSVSGLFFGTITTVVAMAVAVLFRFFQGGLGVYTGIAVILSSGLIGILWRQARKAELTGLGRLEIYLMGLVVHVVMLLLIFTLPSPTSWRVLTQIALPVLAIYPVGEALIGRFMRSRLAQMESNLAMAESEELFRSLFENNHAVMLILDPKDGAIIDANPAAAEFYGWSRDEIRRMKISEINCLSPEDVQAEIERARQEEKRRFFFQHALADGSVRDVEVYSGPIQVEGRAVLYSIIHDITERGEAEKALRISEKKYRNIFENAQEGIFQCSPEGRFITVNPALARMSGYDSPAELVENVLNIAEQYYVDPEAHQVFMREIERVGFIENFEFKVKRKDGEEQWVASNARIIRDAEGMIEYYEGMVIDISGRKAAEELLLESEEKYRSVMEAANAPIVVYDTAGRALFINPAFTRVFGWTEEEILGRKIDFVPEEEKDGTRQGLDRLNKDGKVDGIETRRLTKHGEILDISISAAVFRDNDDRIMGTVVNLNDITKIKRAEKELRKSEAFLRGFFRTAPVGLGMSKDRTFQIVNEQLAEMTGYSVEELVGMEARRLYYSDEDYLNAGEEYYGQVRSRGFASSEAKWRHKDGRRINVLMNAAPVSTQSAPTEIVFAVLNITEKKEREKQYHLLFEGANDAIILMKNLVFVECNTRALEMYGAAREEIIGRTPLDFTDPLSPDGADLADLASEKVEKTINGIPQSFEWRHRRLDGVYFDAEISLSRVDIRGQVHVQAIVRDITERKQAEYALRKSQDYLTSLFRTVPTGITVHEGRVFTMINKRITEITGYSEEELLGRTTRLLYWSEEEYEQAGKEIFGQIEKQGFSLTEVRLRHKNGREIQALISSALLEGAWDGATVIHSLLDITESVRIRKELEKYKEHLEELVEQRTRALRRSEEKYRTILENMEEGYYEVDLGGTLIFVNDSLCKIWGYTRDELIGMNNRDYSTPDEARRIYQIYSRIYQTGRPETLLNYEIIRKDGLMRTAEVSASILREQSGRPIGFWGVARDITERKRFEQELKTAKEAAEAANRAKSEFLANMSHEIRTPMNAVVGMSELLLNTELTRKQKYYAGAISEAAGALLIILNDILDLSKIQAGKLNLENVPFNLREVVEQVGQILALKAQGRDLEVLVRFPINLPNRYLGDPTRIRQVLMNLADNAVKFTEKGYVLLEVSMSGREGDKCSLHFSVTDTGMGISPEKLSLIFDEFSQEDESTTRRFGGVGLGLAISKRLVSMMGGTIGAESTPDRGSVFFFNLILSCCVEDSPEFNLDMDFSKARILVVDDNERNREIALEYLQLRGSPSGASASARAALARLRQAKKQGHPFDMAILDYNMPDMDGGELALAIKKDPDIGDTVLILLSSFTPVDELPPETRSCFRGGLNKPIKVSQFFETLQEAWNAHLNGAPKRVTAPAAPAPSFQPLKFDASILLVEDSRMNRQVAMEVLKRFGCRVDAAENGLEAVEMFESNNYDLVLMDIHMPVMDGFEASQTIRKKEGGEKRTPIVAMTALAMEGDRDKCLKAGMDDYIPKPIRSAVVRDVLVRMLAPGRPESGTGGDELKKPSQQDTQVLNPRNMLDISGGDPEIIEALIKEYMRDAPIYLEDLKAAVKEEDPDLVYKTSHRLQGLTANAGGERARVILLDLESKVRQGRFIPDIIDMNPLDGELEQLRQALLEADWQALCKDYDG